MYDAPAVSIAPPPVVAPVVALVVPLVVPVVVPLVVPVVVPVVDPVVEPDVLDDIPPPTRAFVSMNRSLAVDDELVVLLVVPAVVPDVPVAPGAALAGCRQPVTVTDF
jgi:hypothetical protein